MNSALPWRMAMLSMRLGCLSALQRLSHTTRMLRSREGRPIFPYIARRGSPSFQVLTYHRLATQPDQYFPSLSVDTFELHVRFLARYYTLMNLAEVVSRIRTDKPMPENVVALTFDDGYRDNYDLAFPILRKYNASATIFLTTDFVDRNEPLWNDKVCFALKHTQCREFSLPAPHHHVYPLETAEDRISASETIRRLLRQVPHDERLSLMDMIFARLEIQSFAAIKGEALTWTQILEMRDHGITFGAHTRSHPMLSRLSLDRARSEIVESKALIEERLGCPVDLFAYPDGGRRAFSEAIRNEVEAAGFAAAVTTIPGVNGCQSDRYVLCRDGLDDGDVIQLAGRLCWYKFAS
jgi:peptidoglycan/xylan/chitin deacetylase (PgdA/CDA1 family)